jgi:putative hydrolase of the HAD superfamily
MLFRVISGKERHMTDIKGVIFDFGGVITCPQDPGYVGQIMTVLGVTDWERFYREYMDLRPAYDGGHMTAEEYWDTLAGRLHCDRGPLINLIELDIRSWTVINQPTLALASTLRQHGIATAVLSNMNEEVLAYLEAECPWTHDFAPLVYSCRLGLTKPQREIYEYCVSRMGLRHDECLFLDDSPANVRAAERYGLHAVVFEGDTTLEYIKRRYFCNIFADKKTQEG